MINGDINAFIEVAQYGKEVFFLYRKCRKAPAFRYGDMRHVHRICASN